MPVTLPPGHRERSEHPPHHPITHDRERSEHAPITLVLQQSPASESGVDLVPVADARPFSQPPAEIDHPLVSPGREIDQPVVETLDLDPLVVEVFHAGGELGRH